ncbi:MAG: hypothetical protein DRN68_05980 [Thaumarchaeota archaeon]|nr:MAG: hypothetical protein DRN68_05980 [Nitrososphaerota archaeon]
MKKEGVIVVTAVTLAFIIGFKSMTLFLQHSFKTAIILLILSFSCVGIAFLEREQKVISGGDVNE